MLELDEFVERVCTLLRIETPEQIEAEDSLYDDLGLDSFQAFELLIIIESLAGSLVPPAALPQLYTVADAFDYYEGLRAVGGTRS